MISPVIFTNFIFYTKINSKGGDSNVFPINYSSFFIFKLTALTF